MSDRGDGGGLLPTSHLRPTFGREIRAGLQSAEPPLRQGDHGHSRSVILVGPDVQQGGSGRILRTPSLVQFSFARSDHTTIQATSAAPKIDSQSGGGDPGTNTARIQPAMNAAIANAATNTAALIFVRLLWGT